MKVFLPFIALLFASTFSFAQYPGDCWTDIDMATASVVDMTKEYNRLKTAEIRTCDTTNSPFHELMKAIGAGMIKEKTSRATAVKLMGAPYWQGTGSEYENNKVTLVRGKVVGAVLPPMFEIPSGDSYAIYQWRGKDLMIIAFKADAAAEVGWYRK